MDHVGGSILIELMVGEYLLAVEEAKVRGWKLWLDYLVALMVHFRQLTHIISLSTSSTLIWKSYSSWKSLSETMQKDVSLNIKHSVNFNNYYYQFFLLGQAEPQINC